MSTLQRLKKHPHLLRRYETERARMGDNCSKCNVDALLKQYEQRIKDYEQQQEIRKGRT